MTARLVIDGADRAIAYYQQALGAELGERFTGPDGKVVHAELTIGATKIAIKDEDGVDPSATTLGGSAIILQLDVDEADAVGKALVGAGGTVVFAIDDTSYGYRQGRIADPFGFQWLISQQIEILSEDETQSRLDVDLA
ncbi:MAG: VOC family protein [Actinomycetes bacterium]